MKSANLRAFGLIFIGVAWANLTSADEPPKWSVEAPPGPKTQVPIETDQGTWMSLDVSPNGKTLVFDLLGDIYVLPIAGGAPKALTTGLAWDMQPTFSPDGQLVAFTSDRGGGDNIWVMKADGSAPRPITDEPFRLLNSPAWSPDGRFIVARKHFTSRRSLGAGELWLYHVRGGKGVQLNKRPNDQKDLGEPAYSPDGRSVYYSQDTTPGERFEYNKDPHGEIYTIRRLELATGRHEPFITGAGGATRPTPSPDGRWVAFIRRVRGKSVLHVHDTRSGQNRPLFDGLDRDLQETWAVHGTYPRMAWTPNSSELVFWAQGGLHRVGLTGKHQPIPFQLKTERTTQPAVRFTVDVSPDRFEVRTPRSAEVSPDGKRVVYQALGYLYIYELASGKARRLTRQTEHFEFQPSWSRDGRAIAYVSWSDEKLGAVRVVNARGGKGRAITSSPGHYLEPVFTPDQLQVVYRKVGGGWLRTPLWSKEPGVYRQAIRGGDPVRITRDGREPHFGADPQRVFLTESGPKDARVLTSVGLDGQDRAVHVTSAAASRIRVSPDGRWLAFAERFKAFVMPFTMSSLPIAIGPKAKGLPTVQVSTDTGAALHWAADSTRVYWTRGPELFDYALTTAFAPQKAGAKQEAPKPAEKGRAIGFSQPTHVPKGVVAIVGARLITMNTKNPVIEDGTVVVEGHRIKAVGKRSDVAIPAGGHVIDGKGLTVIPGLIDVHAHAAHATAGITPQRNWGHYASLTFGVTTFHDPSNNTESFFAASELQRAGLITAPRLFSTGTILYGAEAPFMAEVDSLADAEAHVRRQKAYGAISVKSYNQPRRDQRQQLLTAARKLSMMVVPEGGALFQHNMTQVVDGHTGIEHTIPLARAYDDVVQLWKATEVAYTPTLVVAYGGLSSENYWYTHTKVWKHERLNRFVPRFALDPKARRPKHSADDSDWNHIEVARFCKTLMDAGVSVQIGGHGQREGLGTHWEMWSLAQGGASAHQVLRAATLNGAAYLGLDGDLGSIEPGKLADLAILDKNPLTDIRNSEFVRYTMVGGVLYDARTMDTVWPQAKTRGKLFFEAR